MIDDIDRSGIRGLDGGLLLVFRELIRRPQTTEAARRLGLSQSAVSHALARLRDVFDDPLFIRRPHGLEPTRRAEALAPRIDALIDLLGAAVERRQPFDPAQTERRFVMAAAPWTTVVFGVSLVERLRRQAPRAAMWVKDLVDADTLDAVRRGEVDLAIGRFGALPAGLAATPLFEDRYCVVARREHPRVRGAMDGGAYCEIGHIYAGPMGAPGIVEDPIPPDREVATLAVVPHWMTVLALVASSDAIATVPRRLAQSMADLLGLQLLEPPFDPLTLSVSAVRRSDAADPAIDWLLGELVRATA